MSGRAGRTHLSRGKRAARPKKAIAPKREWVSTVNDLSVHKLTPAELNHRHEIHKSHNKVAAQWELKENALKRHLRHTGSPGPLDQASLSIMREVLSDQLLLRDVLARSDRALAVVKDLFGDSPQRQTGHPSVTVAPNCDSDSDLPVLQKPDPPTHLSRLSQSMMDREVSKDEYREEDRFPLYSSENHVIQRANIRKMKARSQGKVIQQQKVNHSKYLQGDRADVPVTPCNSGRAPDQTALNATVAVRRVRSRQSQLDEDDEETSPLVSQVLNPELSLSRSGKMSSRANRGKKTVAQSSELNGSSAPPLSGDQSSLGLLQDMLSQVEADLDTLCSHTVPASVQSPKLHRRQGLTGFSVALVSTLGRLVHLLKQRETEAQTEAEDRRRLEEEVKEQRGLIDALTAETMTLREEAAALQDGLQQRTAELEQKLDAVVMVIGAVGLLGEPTPQDSDARVAVCQSAPVARRTPDQTQACVPPAILLSPPRQRDNWQKSPVTNPVPLQYQLPSLDISPSCEAGSSSSLSSFSLGRLPSASSLSLTSEPRHLQLSPNAMLAEIAQLSKQNDLIRAQLKQAKGLGSEVGGSPNSNDERQRSSPISTGRVTPQNVRERRTSASSSTGRGSQHICSPGDERSTQQAPSSNSTNVNSVEQRLLELNRQSAAARGRLLELIAQQKQIVTVGVSPTVSPVPPSALVPSTAAGSGGSEGTMLLPERLPRSHVGGERRSAGSDVSSHRFGFETRDGKHQADKQKKEEGWFSLGAHLR
ncbi:spindle and centriole-associated protein 1 isoform X2 [Cololabis saira]|uniref:spindle and centriole-associated protein 1 isoform X2 n=1 Tax=Cololabis saira TaxID=129043 RepID=UPI002AD59199|nr:spindle and centriole-associated protein 1 isoform X2 [Cololabis saira]